jgi:hypothetical protein
MSTPYIVNHVRGRMWLPDDVDLQEMDWSDPEEPVGTREKNREQRQTTRRARPSFECEGLLATVTPSRSHPIRVI